MNALDLPRRLETARLVLREPRATDATAMYDAWAADAEVTRYLSWSPHRGVDESAAHIARCLDDWSRGAVATWFIELAPTGELIGSIAARPGEHGVAIGYVLARDAWGQGFMREAVEVLSAWVLGPGGAHRVWATCDIDNRASARVLEKSGFVLEGVLRRWAPHHNLGPEPRDAMCWSRISGDSGVQ